MTGLDVAAVTLATAVVKGACNIWFGKDKIGTEVSASLTDLIKGNVTNHLEQRKLHRFFDSCIDIVAERILNLLGQEFRGLPDNELQAAVLAVHHTIEKTRLSDNAIIHADLDPLLLERKMRPVASAALKEALLSQNAEGFFWLLLRESCAYLVEVVTTFPSFQATALTEVLRRETFLIETLRRVLATLPERRDLGDFRADYSRQVVNRLDRMELFGITLSESSRRYPLSVAYVSLRVVEDRAASLLDKSLSNEQRLNSTADPIMVEEALVGRSKAFVIGEAGTGKTTLLHWLAVRAAEQNFPSPLSDWNQVVPFFIPLRQYTSGDFPSPEHFPTSVGRNIISEMPHGWVQQLLRQGLALVLVDGVDELPESRRRLFRRWISDLVNEFPASRYILTSRPAAVMPGWLQSESFTTIELQPMTLSNLQKFIRHWHQAGRLELTNSHERDQLGDWERALRATFEADRHLRLIAGTPLLCALLCALNRERHKQLPREPMEIYAASLDMLLVRRDDERGVDTTGVVLTRGQKLVLLEDFALWLVRNGQSETVAERMVEQIGRSLPYLGKVDHTPETIYRYLLERSGLIREPTSGKVDFIHRTFQDYLAGHAAVRADDIGALVKNAHDDHWRNVIVMAAGHAQPRQRNELLRGILARGGRRDAPNRFFLLAIAFMQPSLEIDPELRQEIDTVLARFIPPRHTGVAQALATAGDLFLDLIQDHPPKSGDEAAATIRTLGIIGESRALNLIAEIASKFPDSSGREVLRAWRLFDPEVYGRTVLSKCLENYDGIIEIIDPDMLKAFRYISKARGYRCESGILNSFPHYFDQANTRDLELTDCPASANLSVLKRIANLERVSLACASMPPDFSPLAGLEHLKVFEVYCSRLGDALQNLPWLRQLESFALSVNAGYYDLPPLPTRPSRLTAFHVTGWRYLSKIDAITRWNGLSKIRFTDCPRLEDIGAVGAVSSLQSVILERVGDVDLAPLRVLPKLRRLRIIGNAEISLIPLSGICDLTVEVTNQMIVHGADQLGAGSSLVTNA